VDQPREGSARARAGAGDQVLSDMARLLKRSTRGTDCIARYGYDEFRILLPHTDADRAKVAAERFRSVVEQHTFPRRKKPTIHIDVATYPVEERRENGAATPSAETHVPKAREVAVN
jgi:diguanylate cyclase (GGDEF)-like protein